MKLKIIFLYILIQLFSQSCNNGKSVDKTVDEIKTEKVTKKNKKQLTASDIYQNSKNGIAMIISYDINGIPLAQGTGFFIENNKLVTNYHVIENSNSIKVKLIDSDRFLNKSFVKLSNEKYDLAIVETENINNHLTIDTITEPKVGSKIYTIGNPRGLAGTISEGIISAKRKNEYDLIQITAPISPGNSGGPLITVRGKIIGIATFTLKNSQNLNFAIPIKYISKCTRHKNKAKNKRKIVKRKKNAISISKFKKSVLQEQEHISFKNNTNDIIKSFTGVLIYKDMKNNVLDYKIIRKNLIIPPHLAKRISIPSFDQDGNYAYYKDNRHLMFEESFKVEFRLLSYEIDE